MGCVLIVRYDRFQQDTRWSETGDRSVQSVYCEFEAHRYRPVTFSSSLGTTCSIPWTRSGTRS